VECASPTKRQTGSVPGLIPTMSSCANIWWLIANEMTVLSNLPKAARHFWAIKRSGLLSSLSRSA